MQRRPVPRAEEQPAYWFAILEMSKDRNDFERAAAAKGELLRLGVKVTYRPVRARQGGNHAAR